MPRRSASRSSADGGAASPAPALGRSRVRPATAIAGVRGSGGRWGRLLVAAALLASCGGALGRGAGPIGTAGAAAAGATLTITYTTATSLQVALGDGTVVGSGAVIPAGTYTVEVTDDPNTGDLNPELTISGPGVSLSNGLDSTGMGIDDLSVFGPFTFQPSSSYRVEDTNLGASSLVTFTTTSTATASSGSTPTTSSPSSSSGGVQSNTATAPSSSGAGAEKAHSGAAKVLGTLDAAVSARRKATLSFHGRTVRALRAGSYTVVVADRSSKAAFVLGKASGRPLALSGGKNGKSRSHTVVLSAGRWFFEASRSGPKTYFHVVG